MEIDEGDLAPVIDDNVAHGVSVIGCLAVVLVYVAKVMLVKGR